MKTIAFLFFIFYHTFVNSIDLRCEFKTADWTHLGSHYQYYCYKQGDIILDRSNRNIHAVIGAHQKTKINANVNVAYFRHSNVLYFPQGLEKFFANLEGIGIEEAKLKEIKRDDLKPLPKLRVVYFYGNEIQFLEPNLFEFNPKLEFISLKNNKISHIDSRVFDNFVDQLRYLYLSNNACQFEDAVDDKSKVNQVVLKVQSGFCNEKVTTTLKAKASTGKITTTSKVTSPPPAKITTTPKLITTTTLRATTSSTPATTVSPISSAQFNILTKLIEGLRKEIKGVKDEMKTNQNELKSENSEMKKSLKIIADQTQKSGTYADTGDVHHDNFEQINEFIEIAMGVVDNDQN